MGLRQGSPLAPTQPMLSGRPQGTQEPLEPREALTYILLGHHNRHLGQRQLLQHQELYQQRINNSINSSIHSSINSILLQTGL